MKVLVVYIFEQKSHPNLSGGGFAKYRVALQTKQNILPSPTSAHKLFYPIPTNNPRIIFIFKGGAGILFKEKLSKEAHS